MAATVQQIIEAQLAEDGIAANAVLLEKALLDNDLDGAVAYNKRMAAAVAKVQVSFLNQLLTRNDVTEGDLSIKSDKPAILQAIARIEKEAGLTKGPTVTDASFKW